jgi:hypothetical protein
VLPIVSWRAWTKDRVYQSKTHSWADVPATGLQIVCVYHDPAPYKTFCYGVDVFSLEPFRKGFAEFPADGAGEKLGEWMKDDEWLALLALAERSERDVVLTATGKSKRP